MPYVERTNGVISGYYRNICPGVADEFLAEDSAEFQAFLSPSPTSDDVNAEMYRRMNAGFEIDFGGQIGVKSFDTNGDSMRNIESIHSVALAAIFGGAKPGNLRWANPETDFEWICADNSRTPMDADTAREMAEAAIWYRSALKIAARVIKDMGTIPEDYANDKYWPGRALALG